MCIDVIKKPIKIKENKERSTFFLSVNLNDAKFKRHLTSFCSFCDVLILSHVTCAIFLLIAKNVICRDMIFFFQF
jgi:hypothetical protein